jgi:hypothetical protein
VTSLSCDVRLDNDLLRFICLRHWLRVRRLFNRKPPQPRTGVDVVADYPEFASWLVRQEINSISLNPDTTIKTAIVIDEEEAAQALARAA